MWAEEGRTRREHEGGGGNIQQLCPDLLSPTVSASECSTKQAVSAGNRGQRAKGEERERVSGNTNKYGRSSCRSRLFRARMRRAHCERLECVALLQKLTSVLPPQKRHLFGLYVCVIWLSLVLFNHCHHFCFAMPIPLSMPIIATIPD